MSDQNQNVKKPEPEPIAKKHYSEAGSGLRSLKSTTAFRAINFELYVKPNLFIMGIGLAAFTGVIGYIAYMRAKYEGAGYYIAVKDDGTEHFEKKKSRWNN